MSNQLLSPTTKTGRIHILLIEQLRAHPEGVRWVDLAKHAQQADPSIHPKTLNGCIWKLTTNFPDIVEKPSKGLFRLKK